MSRMRAYIFYGIVYTENTAEAEIEAEIEGEGEDEEKAAAEETR